MLYVCVFAKSFQSCLTLCDPMDYSLPGSSVHRILQARILEWVSMPSSRRSSRPKDLTRVSYVSCIDRQVLYHECDLGSSQLHTHTHTHTHTHMASLVAQMVKNLPAMRETWVWSLGQEDLLEKETGSQRVGHNWVTSLYIHTFFFIMIYHKLLNIVPCALQ